MPNLDHFPAELFRALVEQGSEAVIVFDRDGCVAYANPLAAQLLGVEPEALRGSSMAELLPLIGHPRRQSGALARWALRRRQFDLVVSGGGRTVPLACRVSRVAIDGMSYTAMALRDITRRKAVEAACQASQSRLSKILEIAQDAIISIDAEQRITLFNNGAERIFGYAQAEVLGQPLTMLLPTRFRQTHQGRVRDFGRDAVASRLMGQRSEIVARRRDGTEFPAEASISHVIIGGEMVFTAILRDVSRRRAVQSRLAAAKEEAERAKGTLERFLANMSHELRTPLNAIIGFSEVMQKQLFGSLGNERYVQYADDIHRSGGHLLDLINKILDLSKIEAGRMELREEPIDVPAAFDTCLRMLAARAEAAGVSLSTAIAPGLRLYADELRFRQILLNLLSNALKYTPAGGQVALAARADERGLSVSVTDTGIGMAEADLAKALEPFGQVDNVANRRLPGTGLGLPLTKRLTEIHGGTFGIESAPAKGTIVTVRFPIERLKPSEAAA